MDKDSKKRITANRKRVVNRSVNVDRPEITSIVLKTKERPRIKEEKPSH